MDIALFVSTAAVWRYYHCCCDSASSRSSSKDGGKIKTSVKNETAVTLEVLQQQDAVTSTAIIEQYQNNALFQRLAAYEGELTQRRDDEDGSKLQLGIEFAQQKGVIVPNFVPESYITIDVLGKTPDEVALQIRQYIQQHSSNSSSSQQGEGSVIVLVGLSGTGKGKS